MRGSIRLAAALTIAALGFGPAGAAPAVTTAVTGVATGGDVGVQAATYTHRDCVGPGLPGTVGAHTTHTQSATGFRIGGGAVQFSLLPLNPFGSGICPTVLGGPVLEEDFTGTWHMTAVCRGTSNPGAVFLDWIIQAVAGAVTSQASDSTPCSGPAGSSFSLDITIQISPTSLFGIPLNPIGGIKLTVQQG